MKDEYVMDTSGGFSEFEPSEGFMGGFELGRNWQTMLGAFIVLVIVVIGICALCGVFSSEEGYSSFPGADQTSSLAFCSSLSASNMSDKGRSQACAAYQEPYYNQVEGFAGERDAVTEPFTGTRETPYFSDVTNRVLRLENREKEAIRALAKINQERLRRQAERPDATVPWDSHWADWKRANPLGEEQLI